MRSSAFPALRCLLVAVAVAALPLGSAAEQLRFRTWTAGADQHFEYAFGTPSGTARTLAFALDAAAVAGSLTAFERIDPEALRRRVLARNGRTLRDLARGLRARFPDMRIEIREDGRIAYRTASTELAARREALQGMIERYDDEVAAFNAWIDGLRPDLGPAVRELSRRFPGVAFRIDAGGGLIMDGSFDEGARREIEGVARTLLRRAERDLEDRIEARRRQVRRTEQAVAREVAAVERLGRDVEAQFGEVERRLARAVEAARRAARREEVEYLRERAWITPDGRRLVPDYAELARASVPALAPVSAAFLRGFPDPVERMDALLGFVQSIPYDPLTSRATSNGAGFALPLALLGRNRGDCDTKAVALAAILHGMDPDRSVVLLLLEDHALLGIEMAAPPGAATRRWMGRDHVLVEPVGPGLVPPGTVAPETRAQLGTSATVVPLFPAVPD